MLAQTAPVLRAPPLIGEGLHGTPQSPQEPALRGCMLRCMRASTFRGRVPPLRSGEPQGSRGMGRLHRPDQCRNRPSKGRMVAPRGPEGRETLPRSPGAREAVPHAPRD